MRLIDADALWEELFATAKEGDVIDRIPPAMLDAQPTIDAVPVCRCKDCKHRRDDEDYASGHYCVKRPSNGGYFCEDDDYCSYGERKDGDG